jgi:hypothetical protein
MKTGLALQRAGSTARFGVERLLADSPKREFIRDLRARDRQPDGFPVSALKPFLMRRRKMLSEDSPRLRGLANGQSPRKRSVVFA